jgi:hypothetical protein
MTSDEQDLGRIFERARANVPGGLEERLLAGLQDPATLLRYQLADRAEAVAWAIRLSVVGFLLAAVLLGLALLTADASRITTNDGTETERRSAEDEILALSTTDHVDPATSIWPLAASAGAGSREEKR